MPFYGDKQSEKFFGYYFLHGGDSLAKSFEKHDFTFDDVTDMFLSHLHFDHCGGSVKWNADQTGYIPAFPNAKYWSNKDHWAWATNPNPREKASFLEENIKPIEESGQLNWVSVNNEMSAEIFPGFSALFVNGHTDKMMIPHIQYKGKTLVFMADLLPSVGHIPVAWVMAYDTRPLETLKEKAAFLDKAAEEEYVLFFEHDPLVECCTLQHTEKGVRLKDTFSFSEVFGE